MRYHEYLSCAEKHLKGCSSLLQSYTPDSVHDMYVWMELYYLSGYIIEGITVYSAYKLYGWQNNCDIMQCYDSVFTQNTGLDFYYHRTAGVNFNNRNHPTVSLGVEKHHFQAIAKNLLRVDPSFNDVPYLGGGAIDLDVEQLIDSWRPNIRYKYIGTHIPFPHLSQDLIARLLSTCFTIYLKHI